MICLSLGDTDLPAVQVNKFQASCSCDAARWLEIEEYGEM